jgi:glycosyltransferase involved in cell wall biosynthesis
MPVNCPRVSVILPTYNRDRILPRTIKSVLRQTMPDFELIIIDDASTDDTEEVVRSFEDPRIIYIKRVFNHLKIYRQSGFIDNPRNDGLKHARGLYIAYIDSDDLYRGLFLEKMCAFLDEHPGVGMAYADAFWHRNLDGIKEEANCNMSVDFGPKVMRIRNIIRTQTVMHRREVVEKVGFFAPIGVKCPHPGISYVGNEDWDYWLRISEKFVVKHYPEVLVHKINKTSRHYDDHHYDPEFAPAVEKNTTAPERRDLYYRIDIVKDYVDTVRKLSGIKGWMQENDGYILMMLAHSGKGIGEIVEIGSFMGLSTSWLAIGSKKAGREKVTAVDHFKGSPEHQPGAEAECRNIVSEGTTFRKFMKNIKDAGVNDHITPIKASSEEAAATWTSPIRLLFIDGEHSYDASKKDFELWSPFVVSGGYIAFHDIDNYEGVTAFYKELKASSSTYREVLAVDSLRVLQKTL